MQYKACSRQKNDCLRVVVWRHDVTRSRTAMTQGLAHSLGLKLYDPSHPQLGPPKYETFAVAWKCVNFPVPPENVHSPTPVAKSSAQ
jgi:hypothetical protein